MPYREKQGRITSVGMRNCMHRPELKLFDQRCEIIPISDRGIVVDQGRVLVWKMVASAVIDDAVMLRERLDLRLPHSVIIQGTMHEDDRLTFPAIEIVQIDTVHPYALHT